MKHVECVCDFNGNYKSPGVCADIYQLEDQFFLDFQGDWEFYDSRLTDSIVLEHAFNVTGIDFNEINDILNGPAAKAADFILSLKKITESDLIALTAAAAVAQTANA